MDFVKLGKKFIALSLTLFFLCFSIVPVFADAPSFITGPFWLLYLTNNRPDQVAFRYATDSLTGSGSNYSTSFRASFYIVGDGKFTSDWVPYELFMYPEAASFIFEGSPSRISGAVMDIAYSRTSSGTKNILYSLDTSNFRRIEIPFSPSYDPTSTQPQQGYGYIWVRWRSTSSLASGSSICVPTFMGFNTWQENFIDFDDGFIIRTLNGVELKLAEIRDLLGSDSITIDISNDLDDTSNILDENVNEFENLESGFLDDMNNSLDQLPSIDFTLTDFGSTALFVSNQMQSIYDSSNYIQFIIITPLIIGIALILIGRRDH